MTHEEIMTVEVLESFKKHLILEEKSKVTIEKYMRDVKRFLLFLEGREITKELMMEYKQGMIDEEFAVRSINSMLASVNSFLSFIGKEECRVKNIRLQQKVYCDSCEELTKNDYHKLLKAAKENSRISMVIQTIVATGIRISELSYFTVEAVKNREVVVSCKNKTRIIMIPGKVSKQLLLYAKKNKIRSGIIFRTKTGKAISRHSVWREMKKLCKVAGVASEKVFPHNFRKLFARVYYKMHKDIAKLADILGHSSINTTRIYLMSTGEEHRKQIEKMFLSFSC